jgi:hypothetical protein
MPTEIKPTSAKAKKRASKAAFKPRRVTTILTQIDADLLALEGTPTAGEQRQILRRILRVQRQIIDYLADAD